MVGSIDNLLSSLNFEQFFIQFVSDKHRIGQELLTNCPFHSDSKASLSINLSTGLWKCHSVACPHHAGGNALQFYAYIKNLSFEAAEKELLSKYGQQIQEGHQADHSLLKQEVATNHQRLLRNEIALSYLRKSCGYSDDTIVRFKLGFDGERYWIPIIEDDFVVNVRKYSPTAPIKMRGLLGQNEAHLWPKENMLNKEVYLFEGEKDCMLANQLGIPGITVTAGAGTWKTEWIPLFKGKDVVICYDIDEAGNKGAFKIADHLMEVAETIKIVQLPLTEPLNADFTDYIVFNNFTKEDFDKLVEDTTVYKRATPQTAVIDNTIYPVELAEASRKDYFYKRVLVKAIVAGKDLAPYLVPKKIHVRCLMGKKACVFCGVGIKGGDFDLVFNEETAEILQLINCTGLQQERCIREKIGVLGNCRQYSFTVEEAQNIEEIKLIPEVKYSADIKEYVIRTGYYLGHGCKTNQSYEITAITVPHPQTQYSTHVIYDTRESEMSIEKFQLTPEIIEGLKVFQCPITTQVA